MDKEAKINTWNLNQSFESIGLVDVEVHRLSPNFNETVQPNDHTESAKISGQSCTNTLLVHTGTSHSPQGMAVGGESSSEHTRGGTSSSSPQSIDDCKAVLSNITKQHHKQGVQMELIDPCQSSSEGSDSSDCEIHLSQSLLDNAYEKKKSTVALGIVQAFISAIGLAIFGICTRMAVRDGSDPVVVNLIVATTIFICAAPRAFCSVRRALCSEDGGAISRRAIWILVVVGILEAVLNFLMILAYSLGPIENVIAIFYVIIILIYVIELFISRQSFEWSTTAIIVITMVGSALVIQPPALFDPSETDYQQILSCVLSFVAALLAAICQWLCLDKAYHFTNILTSFALSSILTSLIWLLLQGADYKLDLRHLKSTEISVLDTIYMSTTILPNFTKHSQLYLLLITVGAGLGNFVNVGLLFDANDKIPATYTNIFRSFAVVSGCLLEFLFFVDGINLASIVGIILISGSNVLAVIILTHRVSYLKLENKS